MGKLAKHCHKCGFLGKIDNTMCCEFCVVTGRLRGVKLDGAGTPRPISTDECSHWKDNYTEMRKPEVSVRNAETSEMAQRLQNLYGQIKVLYGQGCNDREIAEKLRCSKTTVRRWRKRNGVPSQVEIHRFVESEATHE